MLSITLSYDDLRAAREDLDREEAGRTARFEADKTAFEADMQKFADRRADLDAAERVWQMLSRERHATEKPIFQECSGCGFLFKPGLPHDCSDRPGNAFAPEELDVVFGKGNWFEVDADDSDEPEPAPARAAAPNGHDQQPEPEAADDEAEEEAPENEINEAEGDGEVDVRDMTHKEMVLAAIRRLHESREGSMRYHIDQFMRREFGEEVPPTSISTYLQRLKAEGLIENPGDGLSWRSVGGPVR